MSEPRHAAPTRQTTYTEVLANREYRALYAASAISWLGDFLARAAVTALVFATTRSVVLSATAFAIGYLPGLTCGPFLAAAAERYSNRIVMIVCDVARAALIAVVAIPGLPVGVVLALLFTTTMLNAPFDASRSALLPRILSGDEYVVAVSLQATTNSIAQVSGYFVGGAIAPFYPHSALVVDAATFLLSALLVQKGTRSRDLVARGPRRNLVRETAAGFQLVLTDPLLRAIAILVFGTWAFAVVPEGLGAAWAGMIAHNASDRGFDQALIMMSVPVGGVLGGLVVARLVRPEARRRLIRPLSVVVPLALVPTVFDVPPAGIAILAGISGIAVGGLIPPANGLFVQALPSAFRARAFGVIQFGLQLVQAVALFVTGALADRLDISKVVGWWSVGGVCVMLAAGLLWPSAQKIDETLTRVRVANAEVVSARGRHSSPPSPGDVPPVPRQGLRPSAAPAELETTPPDFDTTLAPAREPVKAQEPTQRVDTGATERMAPEDGHGTGAGATASATHREVDGATGRVAGDAAVDLQLSDPGREMVTDVARQNGHAHQTQAAPGFEL